MITILVISTLLIGINALFVLVEFALVKVRSSRVELLARKGDMRARVIQEILGSLDEYLAACQLGITITSITLGWLGQPALAALIASGMKSLSWDFSAEVIHGVAFATALLALAFTQIIFGELVPRSIGIQKPDTISLWAAIPLKTYYLFLKGPIHAMASMSSAVLRLIGMKPAAKSESDVSPEEMRILLGETQEKGGFPFERLLFLENLFDLGAAKVSDTMVPRNKVAVLSLAKSWDENFETIRERRFSRYPLCRNGLDSVIGMVHIKDLLLQDFSGVPDLTRIRRELAEIREGDSIEKLIKSFPDNGIHMALVRNAPGDITGILTIEDLIEELVGEVYDEFDLPKAWSLADILTPSCVAIQMTAGDKEEAISQLLAKLKAANPSLDAEAALKAVWEREMKLSSGVGRGIAVPHGRLQELKHPLIALGRFDKPVPFANPDNVPVRLVFLILTPSSSPMLQLRILGRIASLSENENLRRKLLRSRTAESMLEILRTADTILAA